MYKRQSSTPVQSMEIFLPSRSRSSTHPVSMLNLQALASYLCSYPPEIMLWLMSVNTQLFNLLCDKADDVYGGKLPIHVRCLIDECANIGQIPNLEKLVATIRSREISACLVLQARSQLKAIYKDNADTIVGNMDSQIFLGGSEPTTLKDLSEMLGKETIDAFNTSDTRGNSPSYGTTFQKMGHDMPYLFVKSSVALNLS